MRSQQRLSSVRATAYRHDAHNDQRAAVTPAAQADARYEAQAAETMTASRRVRESPRTVSTVDLLFSRVAGKNVIITKLGFHIPCYSFEAEQPRTVLLLKVSEGEHPWLAQATTNRCLTGIIGQRRNQI